MPVPAIAIHASGSPDKVARATDANFEDSPLYDRVVTLAFNWDSVVPHSGHQGFRNLCRFLTRNAANISAASRTGLEFGSNTLDRALGVGQIRLHRLLQWVLSGWVAMLFVRSLAEFVVLAPAAWYGLAPATFAPMRWMVAAEERLQIGMIGGITALILGSGLRLLLVLSPRPFIVTLRSIVLLLLQPVLIITIAALVASPVLLWALFGILGLTAFLVSGADATIGWAVALGVLLGLRALWGGRSLRGPIKTGLDLFRYLGEPEYRQRIQQALDKAIARARARVGDDRRFVLAGQGLGSVMALDCVMHSPAWRKTDNVLLVTMGSPLRRYFLSLYPRTPFPESMEHIIDLVAGRLDQFRWINIYRPWDYMGAGLGLKPFNGRDLTTGLTGRLVVGHADYLRSLDARHALHDGLHRLGPVRPPGLPIPDTVHQMPDWPSAPVALRIPHRARALLYATFALGTFGWILWWVSVGSGVLSSGIVATPELLERRGVVVEAAATHLRQTVESARTSTYVHHWHFAFTDPKGAAKSLNVRFDVTDRGMLPLRFDDRALTRQIRAGCAGTGPTWWPTSDMEAPCTLDKVRLRYYPGDMALFDLPDFPQQRFGTDPVRGWTEAGVVAVSLSMLLLISMILGVRLFVLIVG